QARAGWTGGLIRRASPQRTPRRTEEPQRKQPRRHQEHKGPQAVGPSVSFWSFRSFRSFTSFQLAKYNSAVGWGLPHALRSATWERARGGNLGTSRWRIVSFSGNWPLTTGNS